MLYLDASAMFKRYVSEVGSALVETTMMGDDVGDREPRLRRDLDRA